MTWVKICGMTNLEDALVAVEAGADAVGFVFYEKSPRCVSVEKARAIVEKLPQKVTTVGVFVGAKAEAVGDASMQAGLTAAQIYPRAPNALNEEFMKKIPCRIIPAVSAEEVGENELVGFQVSTEAQGRVMAFLLDSGNKESPGGTGLKFDWKGWGNMAELASSVPLKVVVAGGLTPENVSEAIGILKPWGVDVVSGVEACPGKKDPEKVRAFVRAVREADRKAL